MPLGWKMIISAKDRTKRCQNCKAVVGGENDGFCKKCGEFFEDKNSRWFDTINDGHGQFSYGSLDIEDEAKGG